MSVKLFSPEMIEQLNKNPYVERASSRMIIYSEEFKDFFIDKYKEGLTPGEIFRIAGFDVDALGYKRIEKASDRWRKANNVSTHREKLAPKEDLKSIIAKQEKEIARLNAELAEIKNQVRAFKA